jgi:hypothetical protein
MGKETLSIEQIRKMKVMIEIYLPQEKTITSIYEKNNKLLTMG